MAIVATDGFDHYNSYADMEQRYGALQYANLGGSVQIDTPGRAGYGKCLAVGGNITMGLSLPISKVTFGFAVNFNGIGSLMTINLLDNLLGGQVQCHWTINTLTGAITFYDANGVVQATALNAIGSNGYYFIEMQNTISKTGGTAALQVNGQPIPSFSPATGLDTQSTTNSSMSGLIVSAPSGNVYFFDDLYICDGTTGPGSYPCNSFLGDARTNTGFPVSNSSVSWTPLTGANWQEVSETAMDSDVSYNRTATAGAQDTFNFGALDVDVNQVVALSVTVAVRKEDAGSRTIAPVLVIGGSTYQGTAVSVDVSYLYITTIWPINPHTSASWTAADINALVAGYVVVT